MPDATHTAENDALTFETVLAFCECCTEAGLRANMGDALTAANHDPACPVRTNRATLERDPNQEQSEPCCSLDGPKCWDHRP